MRSSVDGRGGGHANLREIFTYKEIEHVEASVRESIKCGDQLCALEWMEKGVALHKEHFGITEPATVEAIQALLQHYLTLAMRMMHQGGLSDARKHLVKAEQLCESLGGAWLVDSLEGSLQAIRLEIWKSMAQCLQRSGLCRAAWEYLKKARHACERRIVDIDGPATSEQLECVSIVLAMCTSLSCLGKHQAALKYAKEALMMAQEQRFLLQRAGQEKQAKQWLPKCTLMVVVAYHNRGVEEEFLGAYEACLASYRKALAIAQSELPQEENEEYEATCSMMESALADAEQSIEQKRLATLYPYRYKPPSMPKNALHLRSKGKTKVFAKTTMPDAQPKCEGRHRKCSLSRKTERCSSSTARNIRPERKTWETPPRNTASLCKEGTDEHDNEDADSTKKDDGDVKGEPPDEEEEDAQADIIILHQRGVGHSNALEKPMDLVLSPRPAREEEGQHVDDVVSEMLQEMLDMIDEGL